MKKRSSKIYSFIFTFLMVLMFTISIVDTTAFARGSSTGAKSGSSANTVSPKSGATSGSFSTPSKSTSGGTSKSTTAGSSGSSVSGGSTTHSSNFIFLPSFGGYNDSYGIYHSGYRGPSLLGSILDLIVLVAIIWFIVWIIKRRRR